MFLCEILIEQAPPPAQKFPAQHVHVHVEQPKAPKEKKEQPAEPSQVQPVQQAVPQQAISQDDLGYDEYDPELDASEGDLVQEVPPFQEILPMKRYYLIQKLSGLKNQLEENNIQNEDFDIIMKFINSLSYDSILSLASGIIPVVEDQLARLTTNVQ